MKNIITTLLLLGSFSGFINLNAQEKKIIKKRIIIKRNNDSIVELPDLPELKDTIILKMKVETDTTIEKKVFKLDPIISSTEFDFGFANLQSKNNSNLPAGKDGMPELKNSMSFGIGFGQNWGFNIIKGKLRFWTGIRYDITNYRFNNSNTRLNSNENTFGYRYDSANSSSMSKVVVNYLGVPLALGYQSDPNHPDKGFWMKAGVTTGYLVRAHTKVKMDNGKKDKEFDDFNFNNFAVTPFVYVGYNSVALYAKMTTTSLFKPDQGPEANAFQFGLVIQ